MSNSVIVYNGPSLFDGAPIIAVLTGLEVDSKNPKTGHMAQTYIIRSDKRPTEAVNDGSDSSVCGECKHRGDGRFGRSCYVTWWQAPLSIYLAYQRGNIPEATPADAARRLAGLELRVGSYGDPVAVPAQCWQTLLAGANGWTGYTHQWRTLGAVLYRSFLMASVDSEGERAEADLLGWRTFRCRNVSDDLGPNEVICPASEEADHSAICADCQLCRGTDRQAKSVAIIVHGQRARWFSEPRIAPNVEWIPREGSRSRSGQKFTHGFRK